MKRKIEYAIDNFKHLDVLSCPRCHEALSLSNQSLKCLNNHTYNLNKKGIAVLATPLSDKIYNEVLFKARRDILTSDIYKPFIDELTAFIEGEDLVIVDVGCGEGTYLKELYKEENRYIGIDLSKDALNIASDFKDYSLLLSDLANLPLQDKSVDVLLNILSPANYEEFKRVLSDDGLFIKVILEEGYLKELREEASLSKHSNEDVYNLLESHMTIVKEKRVTYTSPVDEGLSESLKNMTPMTSYKQLNKDLEEITIDLRILLCQKKENV